MYGGGGGAAAARTERFRLATDHLQHDEFSRGELVGQSHHRLLVVADEHTEHVDPGVDGRNRRSVSDAPHADRVVARSRHRQFVVVRQRTAPHLHT